MITYLRAIVTYIGDTITQLGRWVLFVNVPVAVVMLVLTPRLIPEPAGAVLSTRPGGRPNQRPDTTHAPVQEAVMSAFTQAEIAYLQDRRLARLATVGPDGTPHISPVGMWHLDPDTDVIAVTGHDFAATKKYRDVARTGRAAIVIDDVLPPFQPRGVEIRGSAEAVSDPEPAIHIHPQRIVGWGLDHPMRGRNARSVARRAQR